MKTGGNYAGAFAAQHQALAQGCDQVVWLDATEHAWVEEMGGMNLFFVRRKDNGTASIMTPALTGTLLPMRARRADRGVRQRDRGRRSIGGQVKNLSGQWQLGDGKPGPVTQTLREALLGLQYGHQPDPFGWIHKVC